MALKPLAVVLILMAAALHPRAMPWRLAVALLVMLMAPFVIQPNINRFDFEYVIRQYDLFGRSLMVAGNAGEAFSPADISGMLRAWHAEPAPRTMLLIRAG